MNESAAKRRTFGVAKACRLMISGLKVKRKTWERGHSIVLVDGKTFWSAGNYRGPIDLTPEDLIAKDWMVVE